MIKFAAILVALLGLGFPAWAQPVCNPAIPNADQCLSPAASLSLTDILRGTQTQGPNRPNQTVKIPLSTLAPALFSSPSFGPAVRAVAPALTPATPTTIGGIKQPTSVSHQWISGIGNNGSPILTQPAFGDISGSIGLGQLPTIPTTQISGLAASATTDTTNATNITTGTLPAGPLTGANASGANVTPSGATTAATLAALAAQQGVLLDTFRVAGDADDTASMTRAVAAGVCALLGPKTYAIHDFGSGAVASFCLKGVQGKSVIQRPSATNPSGTFFGIGAANVYIDGVTFDANKASVTANQWGVLLNAGGQNINIRNSTFENNSGSLGSCLSILSTGPAAGGSFTLFNDEITGCTFNPLYLASVSNGVVDIPYVHDNPGGGIQIGANGAASSTNYAYRINVTNGRFSGTGGTHVTIDGFAPPFVFGTPGAMYVNVIDSTFLDGTNSNYQVAVFGDHNSIIGSNFIQTSTSSPVFGAIDCNSRYSNIKNNDINLSGASFGIDCGGAVEPDISYNRISLPAGGAAIDPGGTQNASVRGNRMDLGGSAVGILAYILEGSNGSAFPTYLSGLTITQNTFIMTGSSATGIQILDGGGASSGSVGTFINANNFFTSGSGSGSFQDIQYATINLHADGNTHNGTNIQFIDPASSGASIQFDNVFDRVQGSGSANTVQGFVNPEFSAYGSGTKIFYGLTTALGANYTAATTLSATTCTGFAATPLINAGQILGMKITNHGTGCSSPVISASDSGGGSGATFSAVTSPRLPYDKDFSYTAAANVLVQQSGGFVGITGSPPIVMQLGATLHLFSGQGTGWGPAGNPVAALTTAQLTTIACNATSNNASAIATDALSPTYGGTLAGSGAVRTPVICQNPNWTTH